MNKYIEHIINDLVRDTKIDYDQERIYFPHLTLSHPPPPFPYSLNLLHLSPLSSFSKYCKENYGLTKEEIDYVWDQYRSIIKDKISKRES